MDCKPYRENDGVKEIYDQLSQPSNGIILDRDTYQSLLKNQQEQQQEAKKWEPVKDAFTNILNKLNSSDV